MEIVSRDALWRAMRSKKVFTVSDIVSVTKAKRHNVYSFIKALQKANILSCKNPNESRHIERQFLIKKDVGVHAPQVNRDGTIKEPSIHQKLWCAMKILKRFEVNELCLAANVRYTTAIKYIRILEKSGYVVRSKNRRGFSGPSEYIFFKSKDTGRSAPIILKDGRVKDANTHNVMPFLKEVAV